MFQVTNNNEECKTGVSLHVVHAKNCTTHIHTLCMGRKLNTSEFAHTSHTYSQWQHSSMSPHKQWHLTIAMIEVAPRRDAASLTMFHKYYFGCCSEELSYCVPGPKNWRRCTRLAASSHEYCVEVCDPRIDRYGSCFFPFTGNLWNSLPPSTFPPSYDLSSFKSRVYRHLRGINY